MSHWINIGAGMSIEAICPRIPPAAVVQVAEILACCEQDPALRQAHRRDKLKTFPTADRALIRQYTNAVITARSKRND